ncbi:MAG: type IV secretion system DNA-binding domain-containing protein [Candidatus Gracilibacteria bacterium]|nr:type IV secretion system DNA-binding domain-containing protein [Candidatus Gracilibacteria bacterium]
MAKPQVRKNPALLLVKVPLDNLMGASAFEQLLQNLHGVIGKQHISLEIASINQHIYFLVWVPSNLHSLVEGQIYAQFPYAEIELLKDYIRPEIFKQQLAWAGAEVGLKRSDLYPFKAYSQFSGDSMAGVFSLFSKAEEGEQVWLQIVIKHEAEEGQFSFRRQLRLKLWSLLSRFNITKFFRTKKRSTTLKMEREAAGKKAEKDLFRAAIRIAYVAQTPSIAKAKLHALAKTFTQFDTTDLNSFRVQKSNGQDTLLRKFKNRSLGRSYAFNVEEIATLYHLPEKNTAVPNIVYVLSKKGEPPRDLPKADSIDPQEISVFGTTNFHNQNMRFGILREDRRRHLYAVGKSGTGKSKLLELLINEDIQKGKGVGVLDPHGDLIDNILRYIPKERIKDVVLFDPTDTAHPPGFNPIEKVEDDFKQQVTMGFIEILKKLFGTNWSSRLEHVLRYTTLALLDYPSSTVLGIMKMLNDKNYRQKVVAQISDPVVKNFWVNEFASWSEKYDNEAIVPLLNKIGQFVSTSIVRNIVGQPKNLIDMQDVLDNQKILLMKVPKGILNEENCSLIGSMLITKIQQATMRRASQREEDRKDFYLYVDEFQYFATRTFAEIFSEARKYRLNLTVSNQYISQLSDDMKATTFGNVGSMISFRVGADDANFLEKEFHPIFSMRDLVNLGVREFYTKMSVNGQMWDAFSGRTLDVPSYPYDYTEEIREASRQKYTKPVKEVEELIKKMDEEESKFDPEAAKKIQEEFEAPIV